MEIKKLKIIHIVKGETETFELYANSIREVLSLLQLQKGAEFINRIITEDYRFILLQSNDPEKAIALTPEVIFSDFSGFDTLVLIKDISGETGGEIIWAYAMMALTELGVSAGAAAMIAEGIVIAVGMAVTMGLGMLMQALSPTPEFSTDPAAAQNKSNLFNGAPLIRNQGGIVPLVFGSPYCGAVLISSGIFSEEVSV